VGDAAPDGWLVQPDDEGALADALATAVDGDAERVRRGLNAGRHVCARYAWDSVARELAALYDDHVDGSGDRSRPAAPGRPGARPTHPES